MRDRTLSQDAALALLVKGCKLSDQNWNSWSVPALHAGP
jgi:hypothetical protein